MNAPPTAKPRVLYFVEHAARELDIACLVGHLLERDGLHVEIVSLAHDLDRLNGRQRPSAVVFPYFYSQRDAGVRQVLLRLGHSQTPIVNLAFEQLFSRANKQFKRPRDRAAQHQVIHCAAGEFFRRFLRESGVPDENVAVIGGLAAALCRPPYRDYFENRRVELAQKFRLPADQPWLFFPENYAAAFFSEKDRRQRIRGGFSPAQLEEYVQFTRQSFRLVMNWLAEAADQGMAQIIVRPRPATPHVQFTAAFEEAIGRPTPANLHIIKDGTVREWLLSADATASSYSSTVVEAAAAGKPVCLASPLPIPASVLADWNDAAPQARTREEFYCFLTRMRNETATGLHNNTLIEWAEANLLAHGDPIQNVAKLVSETARGCRSAPAGPVCSLAARASQAMKEKRRRIKRSFSHWLAANKPVLPSRHEQDVFDTQQVQQRIQRWARRLGPQVG